MIVASALMFQMIVGQKTGAGLAWLPAIGLIVAGLGAGIGAMFTETTSAYIVRFVGTAAGFAVILHSVVR